MRKWKELTFKEKALIIGGGVLVTATGIFFLESKLWHSKYEELKTIPITHPSSKAFLAYRPDLADNMKYALEIYYAKIDDSSRKFVGEIAFSSAQELSDFGKWIQDTAVEKWISKVGGGANETAA